MQVDQPPWNDIRVRKAVQLAANNQQMLDLAHRGMGVVAENHHVAPIQPDDPGLKIPHMGWNTLHPQRDHPVLDGIETGPDGQHAYFVHSYALQPAEADDVLAVSSYGGPLTAIVARDNLVGTQFHPEKSQALGLKLIANYLRWRP